MHCQEWKQKKRCCNIDVPIDQVKKVIAECAYEDNMQLTIPHVRIEITPPFVY